MSVPEANRTRGHVAGEETLLAGYDPSAYPPRALTADVVLLAMSTEKLAVLLVQRDEAPFAGYWALPGGFVGDVETSNDTARRVLAAKAGLGGEEDQAPAGRWHLEQLRTYDAPGRDPRMRVVSVAYLGLVDEPVAPAGGRARWWPVELLGLDGRPGLPMAFDHETIVAEGIERTAGKLEYTTLATSLLGPSFTLSDLQAVYEAVWGVALHAPNFRRKVLNEAGFVVPTGARRSGGRGRAAELYRAGVLGVLERPIRRELGQTVLASPGRSPSGEDCEPCSYFGDAVPAVSVAGTDATPVCAYHGTRSWSERRDTGGEH